MFRIKMIKVDGAYKALVLDISKDEGNRLVELFEGQDYDLVEDEALSFVEGQKDQVWH